MKPEQSLIAVDDDAESLRELTRFLGNYYSVFATRDPRRAIEQLEKDPSVSVFIVEQFLPSGPGVDLLENVKILRPKVKRILLTKFSDLSGIISGLHSGAINRMISKPLQRSELAVALVPGGQFSQTPVRQPV